MFSTFSWSLAGTGLRSGQELIPDALNKNVMFYINTIVPQYSFYFFFSSKVSQKIDYFEVSKHKFIFPLNLNIVCPAGIVMSSSKECC